MKRVELVQAARTEGKQKLPTQVNRRVRTFTLWVGLARVCLGHNALSVGLTRLAAEAADRDACQKEENCDAASDDERHLRFAQAIIFLSCCDCMPVLCVSVGSMVLVWLLIAVLS